MKNRCLLWLWLTLVTLQIDGEARKQGEKVATPTLESIVASHVIKKVTNVSEGATDPLLLDAKKLGQKDALAEIRTYLNQELGAGPDREQASKFDDVLSRIDEHLTPEVMAAMREEIKKNPKPLQKCSWIGCSLHLCKC